MPSRQKLLSMKFRQLRCVLNLKFEVDAPCETSMTPLIPSPLLPASAAYLIQTPSTRHLHHCAALELRLVYSVDSPQMLLSSPVPQMVPLKHRGAARQPRYRPGNDVCRSIMSSRKTRLGDYVDLHPHTLSIARGWCTDPSSGSSPSEVATYHTGADASRPESQKRSRTSSMRIVVVQKDAATATSRPKSSRRRVRVGCARGEEVEKREV